jgi:hypothetical protein
MLLKELITGFVEDSRRLKEYVCRSGPTDLEPMADFFRGDDLVATVRMPGDSRTQIPVVFLAAAGFDADTITLVSDSYVDLQPLAIRNIIPRTRKPWEHGEITDFAQNHNGLADGVIGEGLLLYVANRAGDRRTRVLPYRYADNKVVWIDWRTDPVFDVPDELRDVDEDDMHQEGYIPEGLVAAMQAPSVAQNHFRLFGSDIEDRGPDWDRHLRDAYACQAMAAFFPGVKVALHTRSDDTARIARLSEIGRQLGGEEI